ncbi:ATPase, T2SS/T4P/T4SS family [Caminibacter pacificus]|uniref:Type II secretory ATPase GspE/PulE/Tfp pilus assembly ATPase PilB-like protein n=1 Tax=Caminibacter pacificus TaxID=1424653 RepID=A0AAJ4RAS0_9BACT|nr:ATPase, T2SS/T4P/T4SS family [Caminibacter pacificus]QDD68136.1 hypothetical protein C6V80_09795 [Caminibacter pacificus]ROR38754.1 type II secretory ATPase GspE/PulE/Tfp pilus assembly ATPase PilB-like protein [Caminibacter pacificus]
MKLPNFRLSFKKVDNNTQSTQNDKLFLSEIEEIAKELSEQNSVIGQALGELISLENNFDIQVLKNILSRYEPLHKEFIRRKFKDKKYLEDIDFLNEEYEIVDIKTDDEYMILRDKETGKKYIALFFPKIVSFKEEFEDFVFISSSLYNYYFSHNITETSGGLEVFEFKDILNLMEKEGISDLHIEAQDINRYQITARLSAGKEAGVEVLQRNIKTEIIESALMQAKLMMNKELMEREPETTGLIKTDVSDKRGRIIKRTFRVNMGLAACPPHLVDSVSIRRLKTREEIASLGLKGLGYLPEAIELIEQITSHPKGLIIVAGATNSGKTTLLTAILNDLYKQKKRILSIENPIEIEMPYPQYDLSITENADEKHKLTREKAMRLMLRHDPDIVLFSEIRDKEISDFVEMGLRGHVTYTTIHASTARDVLLRLFNADNKEASGGGALKILNALKGIIVQSLIPQVCEYCGGEGCEECNHTGKSKRKVVPIYEIAYFNNLETYKIIRDNGAPDFQKLFNFNYLIEEGMMKYLSEEEVKTKLKEKKIIL